MPAGLKAAPVSKALREAGHTEYLVHTGQHYDYYLVLTDCVAERFRAINNYFLS